MQIITSKDNETIKNIKKLKDRKYRDLNNEFIIEGIKLVKEAILENATINKIVICEECLENSMMDEKILYEIAKYECIYVSKKIYERKKNASL